MRRLTIAATVAAPVMTVLAATAVVALGMTDAAPEWRTAADMQTARHSHGSAFVDGILYVVGGGTHGQGTTVEAYDPATNTWTYRASLTESGGGHAVASWGGKVYKFGGMPPGGAVYRKDVQSYDPVTNAWATRAPMTIGRTGASAVSLGDRIYVFGGAVQNYGIMTKTMEVYDPSTDSWTMAASMGTARGGAVVGVLNGEICMVGGQTDGEVYLSSMEIYNPTSDTWRAGPAMPGVAGSAAGGAAQSLWVIGGANGSYAWSEVTYRYDPATGQWTTGPQMISSTKRHGASCAVLDGELYLTGGVDPSATSLFSLEILGGGPNTDPVADAGQDLVVEGTSTSGASVTLDGNGSADEEGDALSFSWSVPTGSGVVLDDATSSMPSGVFPLGANLVTLTVEDGKGGIDVDDVLVTVRDTTSPTLSVAGVPDELWPANHMMVRFHPAPSVLDLCDAVPGVAVSVTSSEADNGLGDGDTAGDIVIHSPTDIELRAERCGSGSGRIYTLVWTATDASGNVATTSKTVVVPKSQGKSK